MNVRVLFFAFFFALFVNIANYLLYQQTVNTYTSVYGDHSIDAGWSFIDTIKNIAFPSQIANSIPFLSLKILFLSIYYFSLSYSVVAFIIKVLPAVGSG